MAKYTTNIKTAGKKNSERSKYTGGRSKGKLQTRTEKTLETISNNTHWNIPHMEYAKRRKSPIQPNFPSIN